MPYSTQLSEYYLASDLYVGALVDFNKHKFVLLDADEYAFRYMEEHPMEVSDHHTLLCFGVGEVGDTGTVGCSPFVFFFLVVVVVTIDGCFASLVLLSLWLLFHSFLLSVILSIFLCSIF